MLGTFRYADRFMVADEWRSPHPCTIFFGICTMFFFELALVVDASGVLFLWAPVTWNHISQFFYAEVFEVCSLAGRAHLSVDACALAGFGGSRRDFAEFSPFNARVFRLSLTTDLF